MGGNFINRSFEETLRGPRKFIMNYILKYSKSAHIFQKRQILLQNKVEKSVLHIYGRILLPLKQTARKKKLSDKEIR